MPHLDADLHEVGLTLRAWRVHRFQDAIGSLFEIGAQLLNNIVEVRVHLEPPVMSV